MLRKALAIYAAAFVAVAILAKAAIVGIGLPDWVFPGSLIMMALGLPVILWTGYVQRVTRRAITATPTFTPGGTPSAVQGTMATIGRSKAIAQIGKLHLSGFLAWAAWLFVHILFLIGFRNRLAVLTEWIWAYFTFQRGARLITGSQELIGWREAEQQPVSEQKRERVAGD